MTLKRARRGVTMRLRFAVCVGEIFGGTEKLRYDIADFCAAAEMFFSKRRKLKQNFDNFVL